MRKTPVHLHALAFLVMVVTMAFAYAAMQAGGRLTGFAMTMFGVVFMLLIYGHQMDRVYLHVGNKLKIGADAFDPERNDGE
jgi:hypothetical protein